MKLGMAVMLCTFVFSMMISIIYFVKKRVNNFETKIYNGILVLSIINIIFEFTLCTNILLNVDLFSLYNLVLNKLFLVSLFSWFTLFTIYLVTVSGAIKKTESTNKVFTIYFFIIILLLCLLPIKLVKGNDIAYSTGVAPTLLIIILFIYTFIWIYLIIKNKKKLGKKIIPFIVFIACFALILLVRVFEPSILLNSFACAFPTMLMFFTIENPDLQMVRKLETARDAAEKANRAKTEFLSSMSHEIRTPLNAIVGFSECMLNTNDTAETKEFAQDIVNASHNLLEIVNGILDISKIEANKMEIINKEYNPREVFKNLQKLVMPRINTKPIEFKMNISSDIPGILKGDVGKVKQIVLNILTNAAKYTDKGEITFSVTCINRLDQNKCLMYLSVKDTGRGIKKEEINKLFKKFERMDEDKNTTTEGTGLGLAITKSLAEMMGGRVTVASEYGEGSTFRIYLEQEIVNMEIPEVKSEEIAIDYTINPGSKILIVDDSKINLKVAENILKPYNFTITTVESGFETLELLESQTYDLILMDIMMPKMNGVETLRRLREIEGFDIPVIALTADAIEDNDEKYLSAGFNGYLTKPIDRYLLNKTLNKFLGDKDGNK